MLAKARVRAEPPFPLAGSLERDDRDHRREGLEAILANVGLIWPFRPFPAFRWLPEPHEQDGPDESFCFSHISQDHPMPSLGGIHFLDNLELHGPSQSSS